MLSLIGSALLAVAFLVGILILCLLAKVISLPFKLGTCIYNSIVGAIALYIINWLGLVYIPVNIVTALIAGIFGIPGILVMAIWSLL